MNTDVPVTDPPFDVIVLVGSLRRASYHRALAHQLIAMAPVALRLEPIGIGELPHYNEDDEAAPSPATQALRARVRRADAVLFLTPEYNRSVPGVLKNAIDLASRPNATNAWAGKPAAIISASPGAMGGFGANHHLRQVMVGVGLLAMVAPEAYIGRVHTLLDADGQIVDVRTRQFLAGFLDSFAAWIRLLRPVSTTG